MVQATPYSRGKIAPQSEMGVTMQSSRDWKHPPSKLAHGPPQGSDTAEEAVSKTLERRGGTKPAFDKPRLLIDHYVRITVSILQNKPRPAQWPPPKRRAVSGLQVSRSCRQGLDGREPIGHMMAAFGILSSFY